MKVKADRDESLHRICRYACCTKCRLAMQEDVTPIPNDRPAERVAEEESFFFGVAGSSYGLYSQCFIIVLSFLRVLNLLCFIIVSTLNSFGSSVIC
ncbi:unnamed protein product [Arabidopsis lyrata]|nr:unnamed protein product [Arabidopsis lyrata]